MIPLSYLYTHDLHLRPDADSSGRGGVSIHEGGGCKNNSRGRFGYGGGYGDGIFDDYGVGIGEAPGGGQFYDTGQGNCQGLGPGAGKGDGYGTGDSWDDDLLGSIWVLS